MKQQTMTTKEPRTSKLPPYDELSQEQKDSLDRMFAYIIRMKLEGLWYTTEQLPQEQKDIPQ